MRAVIFDLYHTLVFESPSTKFYAQLIRSLRVEEQAFREAYRLMGPATMRGELNGMADRVCAAGTSMGVDVPRGNWTKVVDSLMPVYDQGIVCYPDSESTLIAARAAGYRIGLASNASEYSTQLASMASMRSLFDSTVYSCHLGCLKPDPSVYRTVCDRLQVSPEECLFVGDGGDNELWGAKNLGMTTVLIDRALPHTEGARPHADFVISKISDLIALLPHINHPIARSNHAR